MKNLLLLTFIISAIGFASCKKNYACKCFSKADADQSNGVDSDTMYRISRKKAEQHCAVIAPQFKSKLGDSISCYPYSFNK